MRNGLRWTVLGLIGWSLTGCHSQPKELSLTERIAEAHGQWEWKSQRALAGDIHVEIADRPPLDAQFLYEIRTGRVRMQLADGTVLVFDGQRAWVSPASSLTERARYTLRTWPYLISLPVRLGDSGTHVSDEGKGELAGQSYGVARLTFDPGASDTPQDWYRLYVDEKTGLARGVAYIITYGRSLEEASHQAHAITYYKYENVEGVRFATDWKLWNWNAEQGLYGMPVGSVRVYNLEFTTAKEGAFIKPADAREDPLP